MSKVKRFDFEIDSCGMCDMCDPCSKECPNGEFVLYNIYEKLERLLHSCYYHQYRLKGQVHDLAEKNAWDHLREQLNEQG